MSVVVSLEDFRPSPRYDGEPWTQARIEEAATATGPWATLETVAILPVDADPENPAYRSFTTQLGSAADLWYRIVFLDADASTGLPTVAVQNVPDDRPVYASVAELGVLVNVRAASRHNDLMRVLKVAAQEIDDYIGDTDINGVSTPYSNPPAMAREVNLERAVEHWQQQQSPFGLLGMGGESQAMYTAADSWDRHAKKLAYLKGSWGFA